MRRTLVLAAVAVFALGAAAARADGEVGLVIQNGDQVQTYCVAYTGDSISGDALLRAAGLSIEQFGGSARTLCAIDTVGCFNPSSFDSCFCQCSGGGNCTYWAFFTQRYGGSWIYSSLAFNLTRAKDGELHGWKWGRGGQQSAPAPAATTFDAVCGGPPAGLATATPTATRTPPPATPTPTAAATASAAASNPTPSAPPSTPAAAPSIATSTTASATPFTALRTATAPAATPSLEATMTATPRASASPAPPATGAGDDGGSATGVIAFAGVAAAVVAAGAAVILRRRKDG
jgi:hypothetical protein